MIRPTLAAVVLLFLSPAAARAADDLVIADFEGASYGPGWVTTGTAFGTGPAHGALPNQQAVDGFQGNGLVNSYLGGDRSTGTLTSPPFTVQRDAIGLLVGGGNHPGHTCVDLIVDGRTVDSITGPDAEHLDWQAFDVRPYRGRRATIRIVDRATGGWGHINVDQIVQTDHPLVPPVAVGPLYAETYRPQFHFTPATNWTNDPNGLVYLDGEYHLFFQHNPFSVEWGNMTWGHAVAPDLVHWQQLPDALKPDELGTMFSGSAVVDATNTSGFGVGGRPPLVAMYTAAGGTSPASTGRPFTQCIAFSNDRGRTWAKFAGNPVIENVGPGNRDPHVIWYEPTQRWVVIIYRADHTHTFSLFDSPDLKRWTHLQDVELPGGSECPDLFPIAVDGDRARTKWVITCADGAYLVGSFDGRAFTTEQGRQPSDFGNGLYAVQSYSGAPDDRRIQIAWLRGARFPRMPFHGQMSFPAEVTLRTTADGLRMFRTPVREIASLYGPAHQWGDVPIPNGGALPLAGIDGGLYDVDSDLDVGTATEVGLTVRGQAVAYSVADRKLSALGTAPLTLTDGRLKLRILVDRTSLETFAADGQVSITSHFLPDPTDVAIALFARGGTAHLRSATVHEIRSAWPTTRPTAG